ncbi:MAG: phage integrase N-terminal SAM-like domain-containing protein, partial [Longimicrobiales bacterium]|nr:phage integrase N-terminal SAM-like domain-containing protein [Longimicrobiales bacterium]
MGGRRVRVVVTERAGGKGLELRLLPGFRRSDLEVVRSLPGRRWDPTRRVWLVSSSSAVIPILEQAFGVDGVQVERTAGRDVDADPRADGARSSRMPGSGTSAGAGAGAGSGNAAAAAVPRTSEDAELLAGFRKALLVRQYSPRTRKVYIGHIRRFLEWCRQRDIEPIADLQGAAQTFIAWLVEERSISRSYHNQAVSALRFLAGPVLSQPALALGIPRPRKETRMPTVLSPGEVARMLAKTRNPKHRALLMLLYSAGLRVGEVVRLRPRDLDV